MNDVTFLAAIGIAASAATAAALAKTPGTRVLAFLGEKSLPIYVAHVVFAAGTRAILLKLHVIDLPVQLLAGTVAGLGLPLLIDYLSRLAGFRYLFALE
jgi:peptidoglycan/LPS O-acetylase OafA/YrhL